jgi:hypothetical protein
VNQKKRQSRTQLSLRLERQEDTAPLTPNSQDLLEALADLLLAGLEPAVPKPSGKENGDES